MPHDNEKADFSRDCSAILRTNAALLALSHAHLEKGNLETATAQLLVSLDQLLFLDSL
jgi:hypothetical protein